MEQTTECRCLRNLNNEPELLLKLPDDLTPYTKIVLNKIYKKYKNDLQEYEDTIRIFMSKQKAEMKHYIECLVSNNTDTDPSNFNEDHLLHVTGNPGNKNESEREVKTHSENPGRAENANNKCCPRQSPDIRQQFTNNIRELNHILESLLCKNECDTEPPTRGERKVEAFDDTVYHPIRRQPVGSSCPYSHSTSKKRM